MRSIPVPCTNCVRFHYGQCHEPPRQCWNCGFYGHIVRFCPTRRRITANRGEPLPGTNRWCDIFGLNDDPDLKRKVLMALKTSPGSAINIDGRCIYRGGESHFSSSYQDRDWSSPRDDRMRSRSRSPVRGREGRRPIRRSRSPLRRYSPERGRDPYVNDRYRSRARTPSPYRPRRPRYAATGSNAIIFPPASELQKEARSMLPPRAGPVQAAQLQNINEAPAMQSSKSSPAIKVSSSQQTYVAGSQQQSQLGLSIRQPLGEVSNNLPGLQLPAAMTQPAAFQTPPRVEDPHFVLGIGKGATEAETQDAYQQRIWELELEKMSDGNYQPDSNDKIWDESIRVLNEARRMILGD